MAERPRPHYETSPEEPPFLSPPGSLEVRAVGGLPICSIHKQPMEWDSGRWVCWWVDGEDACEGVPTDRQPDHRLSADTKGED